MSQVAENAGQPAAQREEFWRPPASASRVLSTAKCPNCGAEYPNSARFCHLCGTARQARPQNWRHALSQLWEAMHVRESLGLATGPLIAFVAGMLCLLAALFTGVVFQANSLSDWQAVQMWRVEWLLAAGVAMLAGILLKKSEA